MNKTIFLLITFLLIFTPLLSASTEIDWHMPKIQSLSVTKAFNNGPLHLVITGKRFDQFTTTKLTKEGVPDIIATDFVITKTTIDCTFDLLDQPVGNWSLVVTNNWSSGKKSRSAILKNALIIDFAAPEISSIFPKDIYFRNASFIQAKILGANYREGVKVKLVGPDGQIINGVQLRILADTQINCAFNLTGQPIGSYELIVTNVDGKSATLKNYFKIKEADPDPPIIKKFKPVQEHTTIQEMKPVVPETPSPTVPAPPSIIDQASNPTPLPITQSEVKPTAGVSNIASSPRPSLKPIAETNQKLRSIFFDLNKFDIRDSELPSLEHDLTVIENNPGFLIVICGYADERGTNEYNLKLSQKRADTIRQFLAVNGITAKMIVFRYGKETPGRTDHAEDQWQQNRRVDISLWDKQPTREQAASLKSNTI